MILPPYADGSGRWERCFRLYVLVHRIGPTPFRCHLPVFIIRKMSEDCNKYSRLSVRKTDRCTPGRRRGVLRGATGTSLNCTARTGMRSRRTEAVPDRGRRLRGHLFPDPGPRDADEECVLLHYRPERLDRLGACSDVRA